MRDRETVAEVNLKLIWDVITQIKIGSAGGAYVVDAGGFLIAHPNTYLPLSGYMVFGDTLAVTSDGCVSLNQTEQKIFVKEV